MQLSTAPFMPMFAAQARVEFLRMARIPAFSLTTILLPIMFYAFFGLPQSQHAFMNTTAGLYMLASYSAYAVLTIVLFSFGASVSAERGTGATRLMRASPLQPMAYFCGKIIAAMGFAAIAMTILVLFAALTGGAHMPFQMYVAMLIRLLLGSIPFTILGFAVGYLSSINSAIGILNLINLPLSFASGLFVPIKEMPDFVQRVGPYLPTYHFGQLAWGAVGAAQEPLLTSATWLAAYAVLFLIIAIRAYGRDERKEFA
ncbi:MAG: ABC transporter permease [Candidatus Eremiobacteraeota bacterium]|nr:ABC transporter permease [Candidatus Eremiobacteraeota bacterium]